MNIIRDVNLHDSGRIEKPGIQLSPELLLSRGPIIYIMFIEMLTDCHGHGDIHGDGTILILCPLSHLEHLNFHSFEVQMGENYSCYSTYLV